MNKLLTIASLVILALGGVIVFVSFANKALLEDSNVLRQRVIEKKLIMDVAMHDRNWHILREELDSIHKAIRKNEETIQNLLELKNE